MNEPKKLKRGLRDISPLFDPNAKSVEEPTVLVNQEVGLRVLSVFSPDFKGDRRLLSQMLGLKLCSADHGGSILSIASTETAQKVEEEDRRQENPEILNPSLKRFNCTENDLDTIFQAQHSREVSFLNTQTIIFDFDHYEPKVFEKIMPVIDQWVILIRPTLEGVSEAYKLIKASVALNPDLEYFLAVDALQDDPRVGELYEKLSDMISRRLHVQLNWLGCMPVSKGIRALSWELHLDQLAVKNIEKIDSIEKMALAAYLSPGKRNVPAEILKNWALKNSGAA